MFRQSYTLPSRNNTMDSSATDRKTTPAKGEIGNASRAGAANSRLPRRLDHHAIPCVTRRLTSTTPSPCSRWLKTMHGLRDSPHACKPRKERIRAKAYTDALEQRFHNSTHVFRCCDVPRETQFVVWPLSRRDATHCPVILGEKLWMMCVRMLHKFPNCQIS